MWQRQQ